MRRAEMDSDNEGVRVGGRCINNLRYTDDTTLIAVIKRIEESDFNH